MKFGLFIPQGWRHDLVGIDPAQHWGVMAGLARRVDGNPDWSSIWVYDHFHPVPRPTEAAVHEAWSLMAAFAGVTGRIRLGQMCTCMGYRNPAYLAKVAATVDVVSEGRLEMGIGAGWYQHEWDAYGYGFPGAGDRLQAGSRVVAQQLLRDPQFRPRQLAAPLAEQCGDNAGVVPSCLPTCRRHRLTSTSATGADKHPPGTGEAVPGRSVPSLALLSRVPRISRIRSRRRSRSWCGSR